MYYTSCPAIYLNILPLIVFPPCEPCESFPLLHPHLIFPRYPGWPPERYEALLR